MRSYSDLVSRGLDIDYPIWSEVYQDFTTGVDLITLAKPIYISDDGENHFLFGVAGIDLEASFL